MNEKENNLIEKMKSIRSYRLALYDVLVFCIVSVLMLYFHPSDEIGIRNRYIVLYTAVGVVLITTSRILFKVYHQIWRYGGLMPYLRLIAAEILAFVIHLILCRTITVMATRIILVFSIYTSDLVVCLTGRMMYALAYEMASASSNNGRISHLIVKLFGGIDVSVDNDVSVDSGKAKIPVAIVGAGKLGVSLAEDMKSNPHSIYKPVCFIEIDRSKIGRQLLSLPVINEKDFGKKIISGMDIQEVILALPNATAEDKKRIFEKYRPYGCRVKVYDYPVANDVFSGKISVRDFDIEELLPRRSVSLKNDETYEYYKDKVILVTGGGGSIGSELCRKIAAMSPKQLIVLDIAENTTYNLQMELIDSYKDNLDLRIEIASVTDMPAMRAVFEAYRPQIVLHAAAHKHVPLMEHNCVEAVKNNIFGTKNVVDLAKEYNVEKFVLVSTDKAVNPTNVMGATKRFCEYIVLRNSFACAVRFGNVMGSAGSVIPLFKKQIAKGGPVTVTDKRIIRYFMTISEASSLILESGAKAKSGELFVLDMGQPVKILDIAEEMVKLSGYKPYVDIDIIETGLRPGEKLYEELLMESATLSKTDNELIFIEKDEVLSEVDLENKLNILNDAILTENNLKVKEALKKVVSTFITPSEANRKKK